MEQTYESTTLNLDLRRGRFRDALRRLTPGKVLPPIRSGAAELVLVAELLQHTGSNSAAKSLSKTLLRSTRLDRSQSSRCNSVLGLVSASEGELRQASRHLQRAVSQAEESEDRIEICRAKLNLISNVEGIFGPSAVSTLLKDTERYVALLGDPQLESRLHMAVARTEGKRGLFELADQHHGAAAALLQTSVNEWLEGVLRLDESALAYVRSDIGKAAKLALDALRLSRSSGHARTEYAALANLATIRLAEGRLRDAEVFFSEAKERSCGEAEVRMGLLDSYAQLKLATGDLASCESLLDEIDHHVAPNSRPRPSWYLPLFRVTRARLLLKRSQPEQAVNVLNDAIALGGRHSDSVRLRLLKADALIGLDRLDESAAVMDEITALSGTCPPAVSAEIDRVKGDLLARLGGPADGRRHLERAVRVLSVVGSASARAQAEVALARVRSLPPETPAVTSARPGVVAAVALLDLAPHPELLGREALALITDLECAQGVAVVATSNGLPLEVLAQHGWSATEARRIARATEPEKRLALGELRGRRFSLTVAPKPDIASRDALGGVRAFVETAVALEGYRREDRRQASLMPFEPGGEPDSVFLSDEMLKIVAVARRIAAGNLPVLITGETTP